MLSDDDRRVLADLEQRVHRSDPDFAARMAGAHAEVRFPALVALGAGLFVLVPPVMLLFGRSGLIVTVYLFLGAVAVVLVRRRRR
ncbi:DUF3040 domain-containing protein [Actinoplanes sp. NEAU-A12]|uniref:DUF3040 domain-containing protein n=1 Tax=Actinoplanes sandaracinus TaxID=3045177 RepID=A0ABT6WBK5_9ACTN|nr:DUF3040 domain-containing protein [Actinoplanes sandaracinus]MDI6097103.1 DUF3040 domain-containing protein [Actinoplanes sandaracinus]